MRLVVRPKHLLRLFAMGLAIVFVLLNAAPTHAELLQLSGKVSLLRVHDVGTKYGPPSDQIDVEVVAWLNSAPGKAFGFQLRNDNNRAARQGMLDLLRDAFNNNWTVSMDYDVRPGKKNGIIIRVWLAK